MEETGIDAEPRATLTVLDTIRPDGEGRVKAHFTLVVVLLEWRAGEGEPIEDATAVAWVTPDEAPARDLFPHVEELMALALAAT